MLAGSRLCAIVALLLAVAACAGDGKPPTMDGHVPGADRGVGPREATTSADHEQPCAEGAKRCATLQLVQTCQGGKWVDTADCTRVLDPSGGNRCTCSPTLMFICQYAYNQCK